MAWATLGGKDVIDARVEVPRVGAWVADVAVDSMDGLSGAVVLDLNGYSLKGTIRRGGVTLDTTIVRVVGGAGGLRNEVDALAYQGVPRRVPLSDALSAGGESLSLETDSDFTSTNLPLWIRRAGRVRDTLNQLALQEPGIVWRTLADGTVWMGKEAWPDARLLDFELLREDPLADRDQFFADRPELSPGTVFRGRRVSYVEHYVSAEKLRTVAWYEARA